MNVFGKRVVSKKTLSKIIRDRSRTNFGLNISDLSSVIFKKSELPFLKLMYLTVYENEKKEQYCRLTSSIPQIGGSLSLRISDLVGKTTGYNTTVISCELVYVIG